MEYFNTLLFLEKLTNHVQLMHLNKININATKLSIIKLTLGA